MSVEKALPAIRHWPVGADAHSGGWRTWVAVDAPAARPSFTAYPGAARPGAAHSGGTPTNGAGTNTAYPGALEGAPCLGIALAPDVASFGKWISPPLPVRPGATYRCRMRQRTADVPHPQLSAPAMLTWRGPTAPAWSRPWNAPTVDRGRPTAGNDTTLVERQYLRPTPLPPSSADRAGWRLLELTMRAPDEATTVEIEGWLRFAPEGRAWYAEATIEEVPARAPRTVTLGTVRATPRGPSTVEDNRRLLARLIEEAAHAGADVVCLPENALIEGTGLLSTEAAEPLAGPTVALLGGVAAARGVWVVAQFPERDGHRLHNTAVLLDREGRVAGTYHKMHLTTGEWERGIVPGGGPVVVETPIGNLGLLVCFDLHFPEAARLTALAGAEVILGPTVGDRWPDRRDAGTRAHAVANGVYVVTSLVKHPSDIVDTEGRLLARASEPNSVAVATVDLDHKASPAGRMIGPDNGTSPGSYWPSRRTDLY